MESALPKDRAPFRKRSPLKRDVVAFRSCPFWRNPRANVPSTRLCGYRRSARQSKSALFVFDKRTFRRHPWWAGRLDPARKRCFTSKFLKPCKLSLLRHERGVTSRNNRKHRLKRNCVCYTKRQIPSDPRTDKSKQKMENQTHIFLYQNDRDIRMFPHTLKIQENRRRCGL